MKYQSLFSGKNKKKYFKLSSIFLPIMLSINAMFIYFVTNIEKKKKTHTHKHTHTHNKTRKKNKKKKKTTTTKTGLMGHIFPYLARLP